LFWKKFVDYLKRIKNLFKTNLPSGNPESFKVKQNSEIELDKIRRDGAIILEKISRRI